MKLFVLSIVVLLQSLCILWFVIEWDIQFVKERCDFHSKIKKKSDTMIWYQVINGRLELLTVTLSYVAFRR